MWGENPPTKAGRQAHLWVDFRAFVSETGQYVRINFPSILPEIKYLSIAEFMFSFRANNRKCNIFVNNRVK